MLRNSVVATRLAEKTLPIPCSGLPVYTHVVTNVATIAGTTTLLRLIMKTIRATTPTRYTQWAAVRSTGISFLSVGAAPTGCGTTGRKAAGQRASEEVMKIITGNLGDVSSCR